jgi:hypothetical protein
MSIYDEPLTPVAVTDLHSERRSPGSLRSRPAPQVKLG